jgi:hypothetical protein
MTETIAPADSQATESPRLARPETDGAALRAIDEATAHVRERALQIRQNPEEHKPRLVLSQHVRGTSLLARIGRQRHIQDCVDQILAKVDPRPAAS